VGGWRQRGRERRGGELLNFKFKAPFALASLDNNTFLTSEYS
jgi:hypothetical protein